MLKSKNKIYERRAKIFLAVSLSLIIFFVGFLIWIFNYRESAPQLFPLNDNQAMYTIKKDGDFYSVFYKTLSDKNKFETCPANTIIDFINKNCTTEINGEIGVSIGKSLVDLERFIGKNIRLSGNFEFSDKQCVLKKCILFSPTQSSRLTLNINKISEISYVDQKPRDKIISYVTVEGDTVDSVAQKFSISSQTIKWENHLGSNKVEVGKALNILPVSGVSHVVVYGDSVESLAKKYKTSKQKIIDFPYNNFSDPVTFKLVPGSILIIPDGEK